MYSLSLLDEFIVMNPYLLAPTSGDATAPTGHSHAVALSGKNFSINFLQDTVYIGPLSMSLSSYFSRLREERP